MEWATSDYANTFSDVYLSPEPDDGGIYLLEEVDANKPVQDRGPYHRPVAFRDSEKVRMRGGLDSEPLGGTRGGRLSLTPPGDRGPYFPEERMVGGREGFYSPLPHATRAAPASFQEYQQSMPSQTLLRSNQGGRVPPDGLNKREVITRVGWDGRPVGTRPDDGVVDSAFYPPYQLRPPSGGVRTPWQLTWAPPYSLAINRATDPSVYGLASCPSGNPMDSEQKPAYLATPAAPCYAEGFRGSAPSRPLSEMCVIKIVLFFVIVILLGMLVVANIVEKQMRGVVRQSVQEALAARS